MVKPWTRRLALGGGAGALLAGGWWAARSRGPATRTPPPRGVLRRGNAAEPQTLDGALATGVQDDSIMGDLMEGLLTEDARANPVPGMATHWQTSDDGLSWTFFLRDAQWSDGHPVTADDFVFSWRRILNPATAAPYAYFLYVIKNAAAVNAGKLPLTALGVRAADAHTLEVSLEHPAPYLLEMLTHMTMAPQPRHVVTAKGKDWARPGNHVGNGPFVLKSWVPNDHVLIEKNPRFHDAATVHLDQVVFYPTDDYSAALQRMRVGELDTQDKLPGQQIDWIRANMPETINPVPQLTIEYTEFNQARPPFNDVRVRHAANLAINREVLTTRITRVGNVAAYGLVPPGVANYPGGVAFDFKAMDYAARLDKARALMRQAGYGPDKRLKTTYLLRATAPGSGRASAAAIQQMLALTYIDISILPNDFPVFLAQTHAHNFDMAQAGWVADFNDAATFLELLQTGGGNNDGQYSSKAFDAALAAAQTSNDIAARGALLARAERIALDDHALMPLFFWSSPGMVWPYVKGWETNPLDHHRSRWVTIDEDARRRKFA